MCGLKEEATHDLEIKTLMRMVWVTSGRRTYMFSIAWTLEVCVQP